MNKDRRNRAFTLVELAAACALTAVLMAGVLSVVTSMARDRQRVALANVADPQSQKALLDLLRHDLACATDVQSAKNELSLHTFSSLNAADNSLVDNSLADNSLVDRPSLVQYQIIQNGGNQYLIRRQQFTDDPIAPSSCNVVAFGVRGINVQAMQVRASRQAIVKVDFGDAARNIQRTIVLN